MCNWFPLFPPARSSFMEKTLQEKPRFSEHWLSPLLDLLFSLPSAFFKSCRSLSQLDLSQCRCHRASLGVPGVPFSEAPWWPFGHPYPSQGKVWGIPLATTWSLSTAWPWGLCYTALLGWEKLLKVQILLRVVMQPCVHLIAELAVHLPVNNSVAGGHFLLLASFPHL